MTRLIFINVLMAIYCLPVQAQEMEIHYDTARVFSSRLPQKISQTGRMIHIIPREQIRQLPVNSLDELLRFLPGIEAQSRGPFGVQSDFIIRGSTFSQVLVLIDGIRLNDPLTGHFNSNIPITPAGIDRIEVIRGPAAAIYGPDAMGGVINIITRTYDPRNSNEGLSMDAGASYGEFDLQQLNAGGYYQDGRLRASGGIMSNTSDGQYLPSGLRGYFDIKTASASVAIPVKDWQVMLRSGYDIRSFNAQYFYTRSPYDRSTEETSGWWNHLKVFQRKGKVHNELDLGFKRSTDVFLFNPAFPPANEHTTTLANLRLHHGRTLNDKWTVSFGLQSSHRGIQSNDRGDHADRHAGAYLMANYQPVEGLSLTSSLRLDGDDNYGFEVLPQLSAAWSIEKFVFRASGGRSVRAADYTERFISTNLDGPLSAGRNIGNPELTAEEAWSAEAGIDYYPFRGIRLSGTYFQRFGTDVIDYMPTQGSLIENNDNLEPSSSYLYAQNIHDVITSGYELDLRVSRGLFPGTRLKGFIGYTHVNVDAGDEITAAKYITNQARHLIQASTILETGRFTWSVSGLWKERPRAVAEAINSKLSRSYQVWNTRFDLNIYQSHLFLTYQVMNIFDEQYADILGAKMPNRWMMAGFRLKTDL